MMTALTTTTISSAIGLANQTFENTFAKGDAAGMADLYTEEGMLLPTGSEILQGRDAIKQFWQGAMDAGIKGAYLKTIEIEDQGDTAIEVGNYTLTNASGQNLDHGKYMVVWKQEDGNWKLHRDIFNSNGSLALT
jgi:uncharacterized protein (TIGR02246 family)